MKRRCGGGWMGVAVTTVVRALDSKKPPPSTFFYFVMAPFVQSSVNLFWLSLGRMNSSSETTSHISCHYHDVYHGPHHFHNNNNNNINMLMQKRSSSSSSIHHRQHVSFRKRLGDHQIMSASKSATFSTLTNIHSMWLRFRGGSMGDERGNDIDGNNSVAAAGDTIATMSSTTSTLYPSSPHVMSSRHHTTTSSSNTNNNNNNNNHHHNNNNNNMNDAMGFAYETAICSVQGIREEMEDECFVSSRGDFGAVFDGHGGPAVSKYLRQNLFAHLQAALPGVVAARLGEATATTTTTTSDRRSSITMTKSTHTRLNPAIIASSATIEDCVQALRMSIEKVDQEVQRILHWSFQGSTLVAVWLYQETIPSTTTTTSSSLDDNENDNNNTATGATSPTTTRTMIVAANVGDSRAILSRNGTAIDLTKDHRPDDPEETARIEAKGGKVVWCEESGLYRVNGNMAMSRAVGDRSERPSIDAEPEITVTPMMDEHDEFIVLATDGLWDVMTSEEAVDLVHYLLLQVEPDLIADLLVEEALLRGTSDNVTVVIIFLRNRQRQQSRHDT